MTWTAVELILDAHNVSDFADALLEQGAVSVDVTDAQAGTDAERAIFVEPGEDVTLGWGDNRLVGLFASGSDIESALHRAAADVGINPFPSYRTFQVDDQDWVRLTQTQFQPIAVSERLWIIPSWHEIREPGAVNIFLDPGLAFGTGSHPTTWLCLDWLDRHLQPGQWVIDYGCGSGILSIAAAKLGAGQVLGVDIDMQAIETSRYNAARNKVQAAFIDGNTNLSEPADVVIANILSGPLKVLAPLLSSLTRVGGRLVLSGVLESQAQEVAEYYQPWFDMRSAATRQGWVRLEGSRMNK